MRGPSVWLLHSLPSRESVPLRRESRDGSRLCARQWLCSCTTRSMKATRWYGKHDVRVEDVPDPTLQHPRDAIIRVTSTAICGSDLHIYDGYIPSMEKGDILGHEFMGIVEEAGPNHPLKKGDRVLIPFQISCGACHYCKRMETALCDTTNPKGAEKMQKAYGQVAAGLFGYSHL